MSSVIMHWLHQLLLNAEQLLQNSSLLASVAAQVMVVVVALLLPRFFGVKLQTFLRTQAARLPDGPIAKQLTPVIGPAIGMAPQLLLLLALWSGTQAFRDSGEPSVLLNLAGNLALVWVVIRASSNLIRNSTLASVVAIAAWIFAALNIVGWIDPMLRVLDSMGVDFGSFRVSVLLILRGIIAFTALIWLAQTAAEVLERRLHAMEYLAPAMRVLSAKLARVVLLTVAVVVALNTIGVNLSGLAIFSGAIGVGVGFGLQKVASNLISGVILLLDQSIKPGDVIEVGESTGVITRLNARYASVTTSDGIEFLIPNEDLITERVTNWTYSNNLVRLRAPVSVSYQSDLHEVIRVCVEATKRAPRVLDNPAPKCQLKRFGPSALELEILFWINDARNGTSGVFGAVLLSVWEAFRAHGIQFADTTYLAELIVSSLGPHAANAPGIASAAD